MPPNVDRILEAAANAKRAGKTEDFEILMGVYDEIAAQPPALEPAPAPEPVVPLELPADFLTRVRTEAAEMAARDVKQFGDLPSPVVEARRAATEQALIDEAIQSRGTVITTSRTPGGGVEPAPGPVTSVIPTLRPSRIRTLPTGEQVYIEPDTGVVRPPSDVERFVESFARQPIKSEREIIRESIERSDLPSEEKKSRIERLDRVPESQLGPGEVEGVLSAALTPLSLGSAVVRDVFFGPSAREARAALNRAANAGLNRAVNAGLPESLIPESMTSGSPIPEALVLPTPLPGATQVGRPASLEPEGAGMLGRVGAILSNRSETIGDEFRRTPVVVDRFKTLGLSDDAAKDAAYALGFVTDIAVPTTLGAGPLAKVTGDAVGATRAGKAAGRAVEAAVEKTAPMMSRMGLEGVTAIVGIGPASDAALVRRAAGRVVNTIPDLTDSQRKAVSESVSRVVTPDAIRRAGPDWIESVAREVEDAARTVGVKGDTVSSIGREVRRALPTAEPMVRVTNNVAVPKSMVASVRNTMRELLESFPGGRPSNEVLDAAAISAAGRAARNISDIRVADFAADDAVRGSLFDRTLPALAESRILRRMAAMDPTRPTRTAITLQRELRVAQQRAANSVMKSIKDAVPKVGFNKALDDVISSEVTDKNQMLSAIRSKMFGDMAESVASRIPDPELTVDGITRYVEAAREAGIIRAPSMFSREAVIRAMVASLIEDAIPERLAAVVKTRVAGTGVVEAVSPLDRQVAAGGAELLKMVDDLPVPRQTALIPYMVDTVLTPAERQLRLLRQAIRYGIAPIPNLPYIGTRLAAATVVPIASIGLKLASSGLSEAVRAALKIGGGVLRTPTGVLSAGQVEAMAEARGLGMSTVDAERVGLLTDTLYRRTFSSPGIRGGSTRALAALRDFIPEVAAKAEQAYRMGVFRAALAAGEPPVQAAALARRSQVDWNAVLTTPGADSALRWIPAASEWAAMMAEVGSAMVRNPGAYLRILRGQVAINRDWSEKYNISPTDDLLASVPFPPKMPELPFESASSREAKRQGLAWYMPASPLTAPVELTIDFVRSITTTADMVAALADLRTSVAEREAWGDRIAEALLRIPGVVAATSPGPSILTGARPDRQLTDEEVYAGLVIMSGAPALLSGGLDSDAESSFSAVQSILQPIPVLPPGTPRGSSPIDHPWTTTPPKGSWIIPGVAREGGKPVWYAFTPSPQGLSNMVFIRSISPEVLERAAVTGWAGPAALMFTPAEQQSRDAAERVRIERLRSSRQ